jgi:hypothetical protein
MTTPCPECRRNKRRLKEARRLLAFVAINDGTPREMSDWLTMRLELIDDRRRARKNRGKK